jgi:hypothetical protein
MKKERKEGRNEGRKEGRQEGRKEKEKGRWEKESTVCAAYPSNTLLTSQS